MSKINLRRFTLARGPTWGIHSLTLIISCLVPSYVAPMYNCMLPCVCIYSYVTLMYSYVTHICYSYVLMAKISVTSRALFRNIYGWQKVIRRKQLTENSRTSNDCRFTYMLDFILRTRGKLEYRLMLHC